MTVVSHSIEVGAVQANGLLSIVERYLREDRTEVMFVAQVDPKADLDAHAAARIARIDADDAEAASVKPNAFEAKLDAARAAYNADDRALAKSLLADAIVAADAVAATVEAKP